MNTVLKIIGVVVVLAAAYGQAYLKSIFEEPNNEEKKSKQEAAEGTATVILYVAQFVVAGLVYAEYGAFAGILTADMALAWMIIIDYKNHLT